jgi:hypothetical protein
MATIQGIYIALFGRPADPAGLAFFNQATNNGQNLNAIGDLSASDEYQDRFEGLNNVQIVTKIYQDLFGRDPDAAGLAFFVAQLNAGTQNINTIAINILDGAQGNDLLVVNNKIASANNFTAAIDTPIEQGSYVGDDAADAGRAFLAGVTADAATVQDAADADAAVAAIVAAGVAGNTITVTNAAGAAVGADETLNSSNDNDTITVSGTYTAAGGNIDGGLGTDRLNVTVAGGGTTTVEATDIVRVERLFVSAAAAGAVVNLADVDGLQQVWANASGANDLTIEGLDTTVTAGIEGDTDFVTFDFANDSGDADAATVVVNGDVASSLDIANIEALTLNVLIPSEIDLDAGEAETVTITGSGDFVLTALDLAEDAAIDASGHVGKLTFSNSATNDLSVEGGASNDVFNITANSEGIVLTGNGGSDLFDVGALSNITLLTNAEVTDNLISITDFNGSADVLRLDVTGALDVFNNVESANVTGAANLAAALTAAGNATSTGNYAIFEFDGNTYIYQNDANAGFDADDGVIELVGFTGDLTAANFNTF